MFRFLVSLGIVAAFGAVLLAIPADAASVKSASRPTGVAVQPGTATAQPATVTAQAVGDATPPAGADGVAAGTRYYLALGDSAAFGTQPVRPLDRSEGYVSQLHARLRQSDPALALQNIGCPGETSRTLISGSRCGGSQLTKAEDFLRAHSGHMSLVTIDIGSNDLNACLHTGVINQACATTALATVSTNVATIVQRLRSVAPGVRMAAMTYYDPYLAGFLLGPAGQAQAQLSLQLTAQLNAILTGRFGAGGFKIADVAGAFSTTDSTTKVTQPGVGTVPLNVARICQWTWMCAPPGPDIHPNKTGYTVIAGAFFDKL